MLLLLLLRYRRTHQSAQNNQRESISDFEKQILFDVLNERYEKRKPCILLSNIAPSELSGYLGERVADRLREDGGKLIAFDWESYRRMK